MLKGMVEMFKDALAFITDPNARKLSDQKYPNGNGMSVRCAKKRRRYLVSRGVNPDNPSEVAVFERLEKMSPEELWDEIKTLQSR